MPFSSSGVVNPLNRGSSMLRVGADDWLPASVRGCVEGAVALPSGMVRPSKAVLRRMLSTFILASAFATGICDLITFARSVKAFVML